MMVERVRETTKGSTEFPTPAHRRFPTGSRHYPRDSVPITKMGTEYEGAFYSTIAIAGFEGAIHPWNCDLKLDAT